MSLANGVTVLGNVSIMHNVKCAQDTQFTAWLNINQMSVEYADDEYYNIHRNSCYIVLVDNIKKPYKMNFCGLFKG